MNTFAFAKEMNMNKFLNILICLALLLGLSQPAIQPGRAAPLAYTLTTFPTFVHPGGAVYVNGSGYTPNTTYYMRYEMPQRRGGSLLAPMQALTSNSQGLIYATLSFDPGLGGDCPSGCYVALYDNPNYYSPELAVAPVALRSAMQPSLTPSQGIPYNTINFTVNNLEDGQLIIDLGGQVVYGPETVAAGSHSGGFSVPRNPRGLPGEMLDATFVNLVGTLPNGMQLTPFTLQAAPPEPDYQFTNLVITPTNIAPGAPFTVTGQIVSTSGESLDLISPDAQASSLDGSWSVNDTGESFPISDFSHVLEDDGSFTIVGRGASIALGDAFSMYDNLSVSLFGRISENTIFGGIYAPAPLTETLQVQAVNVSEGAPVPVGDPIPGVIVSLEFKCDAIGTDRGRTICGVTSDFSAVGLDEPGMRELEHTLVDVRAATSHWGQETDAGGNAHVVFEGEKLFDNPINLQSLDALYGQAIYGHALNAPETESWYPDEPGWQKYVLTVYGRELRFFYDDPSLPPDSMTTFSTTLWFKPPGDLKNQAGDDLFIDEPIIVPMHYIQIPDDPTAVGPLMVMSTSLGKYLGKVYDGWPAYNGFLDLSALTASGLSIVNLPSITVEIGWDYTWDNLITPELWLDGVKVADFNRVGLEYEATFAYPLSWASLPEGMPHELTLKAFYPHGEVQDPLERYVYLYVEPAALWLVDTQHYSNRWASYQSGPGFTFHGQDANPAEDSYGAEEISTSQEQTPQTGPLVNNLIPASDLDQRIDFMGNIVTSYDAEALAPQTLTFIGDNQVATGDGSSIHLEEPFEPLIYAVLPLWAGALSDPLGGWIVTITSGAYAMATANLYIIGDINFDPNTGNASTHLTLDARAWSEGTIYLGIDVLLGFLASGSMTLNPGIGLGMPLSINNGVPEVGQICFRFALDMGYSIGGLCGCIPFTDLCDCLFESSASLTLFDDSLPGPCQVPALSAIVPEARNYGPPAPGQPGCTAEPTSTALPQSLHPMLAVDGLGQVTAAWQGDRHSLQLADFSDDGWVTRSYSLTTLGAELPEVAYYQPDRAVVTWNAYNGDEDILPTLPFTDAMRTTYVAWGLKDGETFTETGTLADDPNGAGGAVLGSCMDNTAGCPSGGQVTAVWLVDRVPGVADMRTRLYYRIFENNAWGDVAAIPLDEDNSDAQPQVLYVDGQPLIIFIRDADGSFETSADRHLAFFHPANPGVVEIPNDLPDNVVEFSGAIAPDGTLRMAFTRIDMPDVGLVDNRHSLYTAEQSCSGSCSWSYLKLLDVHGRTIYAETPSLTINSEGEASIAYRAMGMGPLPGEDGNPLDFTPFRGDTAGLIARTGEQASLNLSDFSQQWVNPGYLTGDGAVNWQTFSVYDPFRRQTFQVGVRFGTGVSSEAYPGLTSHLGVIAQPLISSSALTFAALTDEPDFAVYAEAPTSPYIGEEQTTVVTVTVQNLGMSWDGAGQPLRIAATWDDLDGVGTPAGEALIDSMAAGTAVTLTLAITAPFNAASVHTLYVQALPAGLVTERSTANNTDTLTLGGLPAPTELSVAGQMQAEFTLLSWTASPDTRVTGYHIYRATDDGAFEAVGSTLDTRWVDLLALVGHTYTYYVTAFTAEGLESYPSATVTIGVTNVIVLPKIYLPLVSK
jgi:hypothetical protein